MSDSQAGALIGLAIVLGTAIVNRLLPDGYHFKFMDRFLRRNKETTDEHDT